MSEVPVTPDGSLAQVVVLLSAIGALMPLLVSVVVQSRWTSHVKALIAFGSVAALGFGAVLSDAAAMSDVFVALPVAAVTMQAMYEKYWKPTGIAPWIEDVTNVVDRKKIESA